MGLFSYDEEVILKGCLRNDRRAQESLYRQYFKKMFMMCFRYTSDEDKICEIVNDAFLVVFKNIHKYEHRGSFEGWIRRITFNTLADHFRKDKKNIQFLLVDEYYEPETNDNNQEIINYDYEYILNKVYTLKGHFKDVFIKYAIEGYNHKEIGEELNISEGTSKWYLSEARKKLQVLINTTIKDIKYGQ